MKLKDNEVILAEENDDFGISTFDVHSMNWNQLKASAVSDENGRSCTMKTPRGTSIRNKGRHHVSNIISSNKIS